MLVLSIESHLDLLVNNPKYSEKENIDKILDFIITTFNNLYKETFTKGKDGEGWLMDKEYIDNRFDILEGLIQYPSKIHRNML